MVKKLLLTALLVAVFVVEAAATSVTFQINMRVQRQMGNFLTTDTVVVRGSMNG